MIDVAELRAWVGVTDNSADDLLEQLEAVAVEQVALTSGAYLVASGSVTDQIIGDGTTVLRLPKAPVTAVASVSESWVTDASPSPTAITDFARRDALLYRTGGAVWLRGAEYAVTYTAGYADDAFPSLYRQAVLDIVKALYDAQSASLEGAGDFRTESLGEYSYEAASTGSVDFNTAAASVKAILAQLPRRVRV